MLAIGSDWAVVCDSIIPDEEEREHVWMPCRMEAAL